MFHNGVGKRFAEVTEASEIPADVL